MICHLLCANHLLPLYNLLNERTVRVLLRIPSRSDTPVHLSAPVPVFHPNPAGCGHLLCLTDLPMLRCVDSVGISQNSYLFLDSFTTFCTEVPPLYIQGSWSKGLESQ